MFADVGIDPGNTGMQSLEVSQFLFFRHTINPYNVLLIWQVGLTGDHMFDTLDVNKFSAGLQILQDELLAYYPPEHEVVLYEAATLAVQQPRIERLRLDQLYDAKPSTLSTLVIPSLGLPDHDHQVLAKFGMSAERLQATLDGLTRD